MNDAVLRAEDVHKSYDGLEVLRGVSVEVGRGEVKVIIGPSGSGKSTLLRCLALLEPVDAGAVYLEDSPLSDLREKELAVHRSEVGMVFQRFNLFQNMTALANVMCGLVEVRRLKKAGPASEHSNSSRVSGCVTRRIATPTSCRAGSSSGSRWRGRW